MDSWLSKMVRRRIMTTNDDWRALLCGPTGTAKSYSGISLGCKIYDEFTLKDCLIFEVDELIKKIEDEDLYRGQALVSDELGVAANSKAWMSSVNKAMSYLMQTIRPYNLALIFTSPFLDIDNQVKKLFTEYIETYRGNINYKTQTASARPFWLEYSPRYCKLYFHYHRIWENGHKCTIKQIQFRKPPDEMCEEYEKLRKKYVMKISRERGQEIKVKEDWFKRPDIKGMSEEVVKDIEKFTSHGKISDELIATNFNLGRRLARRIKVYVDKSVADSRLHKFIKPEETV